MSHRPRSRRATALWRGAPALLAAAGCSLITPLDFVGSSEGSGSAGGLAGSSGADPNGGTGLSAGGFAGDPEEGGAPTAGYAGSLGAMAGMAGSVVSGMGGAGAGAGAGGRAGQGGTSGDDQGGMDAGGDSGATNAGDGGAAAMSGAGGAGAGGAFGGGNGGSSGWGGLGGKGGSGGNGGMAAMGGGGSGGCAGANFNTDPLHCGKCETMCSASEICRAGTCVVSPCAGLCTTPASVAVSGDEFKVDPIDPTGVTSAHCFEVLPGEAVAISDIVCWGFSGRTIRVNDLPIACVTDTKHFSIPGPQGGGYCVEISAGKESWAGFTLPIDE